MEQYMTEQSAKIVILTMMGACTLGALVSTFVTQDIILTLVSISSFFTLQFAYKNPKLLMARSWEEFGQVADRTTGKATLLGSRWYFAAVFFSVLYIILV